jgi:CBS domain-containing protein
MGLHENIKTETVSQLSLRELIAVPRGTTTRKAAALMRDKKLGCVIVVEGDNRPIGKFTERMLMKILDDKAKLDAPIERNMLNDPHIVCEDDSIEKMLRLMESKQLRFVCVTDKSGKAIALAGQKSLMEYVAEHFPRSVLVQLSEESKLYMSEREGA